MDAVTLALAKSYTDSQRLAFIEPGVKITFDGDTSGKPMIPTPDGRTYVRISGELPDLKSVESISLWDGAKNVTYTKDDYFYNDESGMPTLYLGADNTGHAIAMCVPMDMPMGDVTLPKGIYILTEGAAYVSSVNFPETIHPIDPKFLPGGGGTPVIHLDSLPTNDEEPTMLSEDGIKEFESAWNSGSEVVIFIMRVDGVPFVSTLVREHDVEIGDRYFVVADIILNTMLCVGYIEGEYIALYQSL